MGTTVSDYLGLGFSASFSSDDACNVQHMGSVCFTDILDSTGRRRPVATATGTGALVHLADEELIGVTMYRHLPGFTDHGSTYLACWIEACSFSHS